MGGTDSLSVRRKPCAADGYARNVFLVGVNRLDVTQF